MLGVWALLAGDFGQTQGKVLATSFCVSGAMLGVLVNGPALARRVLWPVPVIAAATAATGFSLVTAMIWIDFDQDGWWKSLVTLFVVAAGATLVGLLALLPLQPAYEPLRLVHHLVTGLLVATSIVAVWAEFDADWIARVIGVESVVVAALTLAVPAIARFLPPEVAAVDRADESIVCPNCGTRIDLSPG